MVMRNFFQAYLQTNEDYEPMYLFICNKMICQQQLRNTKAADT